MTKVLIIKRYDPDMIPYMQLCTLNTAGLACYS